MFEDILDTQLGAVANCPNAVEFKAVAHAVLFDEHSCGARAGDEVDTLGVERRNRSIEAASVVDVEEAGAVGADKRAADAVDSVDNVFLDGGAFSVFLREAGADDDEAFAAFFLGQDIDCLGAEFGGDAEDGAVDLRKVLDLGVALNALNFGLFGVDGVDVALEGAFKEVFERFAARFMNI